MRTHLITGGCGFVGSNIAKELIKRGEKVRVVDVLMEPSPIPGVEYHQVSVLDQKALEQVMSGVDYVHHNAALVPLKKAGKMFREVNVEGTRIVCEVAKKCGVKHFSHMSSSAIFGNITAKDCPLSDNPPHLFPIEIYGQSKKDAETQVQEAFSGQSQITYSLIRPRTIIGTERLGIFQILFEWISDGANPIIIGNGENLFQFAHVSDIVTVSVESALQRRSGFFNVGTDRFSTLKKDLQALCDFAGTKTNVKCIPVSLAMSALWTLDKLRLSPLGPWHYMTYHKPFYFDVTKCKTELGWAPQYSNFEMLKESYQWYVSHKKNIVVAGQEISSHRGPLKQGLLKLVKLVS